MNKMQEFFNAKAANWDSRSSIKSDQFYLDFVKNDLQLSNGERVLDLGCGTGVITNQIYQVTQSEVIAMDISDKMIEIAKQKNTNKNIKFIAQDFYQSNEKGFDVIICHNAYPHFVDKKGFKDKCLSILNKNGYLIICYTNNKDVINERHKTMDKDLFNEILDGEKEADFYKDKFDIVKIINEPVYVLKLQRK